MAAIKKDFHMRQGETFQRLVRWEVPPYVYKPITAISNTAPVAITAVGHTLTSGWRVAVINVLGMLEINAQHTLPRDSDFQQCTVVDPNTVQLNNISSAGFGTYTSGGYLQFFTPQNLTGYTARMEIKDRIGGTIILTCSTGADARIVLDTTQHTITITVAATDTALLLLGKMVYDLELVSAGGIVTTLYRGNIILDREVTT